MSRGVVIAHGGDLSNPSGGTNRVSAFAAGLADRGFDVTLVVPRPDRDLPERLADVPTSFVRVPTGGVADQPIRAVAIARRANAIAERTGATVQFEHSTLGGVGQLLGGRDYVLDMHDLAHASPLYGNLPLGGAVQRVVRGIEGRAVRDAAAIVVVSDRMKTLVRETWDVDPEAITVVPNGYFADDVRPYATEEIVSGRVTFLGTLHPKLDVEAICDIADADAVEEMVVIGDGAKREALEEAKRTRGLDDLHIEGYLPDAEAFEILARSAVAINPQRPSSLQRASSPVKIYYYAALGLPMVLSEGPSVVSELGTRGTARVVPFEDSFAGAVREVLQDDSRRSEMSEAARRAAREFSWERRVEGVERLYLNQIERRRMIT